MENRGIFFVICTGIHMLYSTIFVCILCIRIFVNILRNCIGDFDDLRNISNSYKKKKWGEKFVHYITLFAWKLVHNTKIWYFRAQDFFGDFFLSTAEVMGIEVFDHAVSDPRHRIKSAYSNGWISFFILLVFTGVWGQLHPGSTPLCPELKILLSNISTP